MMFAFLSCRRVVVVVPLTAIVCLGMHASCTAGQCHWSLTVSVWKLPEYGSEMYTENSQGHAGSDLGAGQRMAGSAKHRQRG